MTPPTPKSPSSSQPAGTEAPAHAPSRITPPGRSVSTPKKSRSDTKSPSPSSLTESNRSEGDGTSPPSPASSISRPAPEPPPFKPANLRHLTQKGLLPPLVYIPEGSTGEIYDSLKRQGLPLWITDRFLLLPSHIKPGWIRLDDSISLAEFFRRINSLPREKTRRVVMYSGDSLDDFIRQFSRQTRLDPKELFDAYFRYSPYIDGGILAGYYRLPYRLEAGPAMAYLTEESRRRFARLAEEYLGHYDPGSFKRYLIIASIIQRETWHTHEMPLIAAVIENRLKRGMKLQIDATLNYGPWSHVPVTPDRIRKDTSHFNTYKFKGLPPEPLGSVTEAALRAALHPAESDVLYFVKNAEGTHDFAVSYTQHLANISRVKAAKARRRVYRKKVRNTPADPYQPAPQSFFH